MAINKLTKLIFSFITFTGLTKTYVFWAYVTGTSIGLITSAFLLVMIFLVLQTVKQGRLITDGFWLNTLFIYLVVVPLIVMISNQNLDYRNLILSIGYLVFFYFTFIYGIFYGNCSLNKIFRIALYFTGLMGILSSFQPGIFAPFAHLAQSYDFYYGRAFGFYLQPNSLASALVVLYLGSTFRFGSVYNFLVPFLFTLMCLLFSASRANMASFVLVAIIQVIFLLKYRYSTHFKPLLKYIFFALVVVIFVVPVSLSKLDTDKYGYLIDKVDFITSFGNEDALTKSIEDDGSLNDRLKYQKVYVEKIIDKPLFGYGFGVQRDMVKSGEIINSAHNIPLEILLQGGINYFLYYLFFVGCFFYYSYQQKNNKLHYFFFFAFSFYFAFYSNFTTTLTTERFFFLTLGYMVSAIVSSKIKEQHG